MKSMVLHGILNRKEETTKYIIGVIGEVLIGNRIVLILNFLFLVIILAYESKCS